MTNEFDKYVTSTMDAIRKSQGNGDVAKPEIALPKASKEVATANVKPEIDKNVEADKHNKLSAEDQAAKVAADSPTVKGEVAKIGGAATIDDVKVNKQEKAKASPLKGDAAKGNAAVATPYKAGTPANK